MTWMMLNDRQVDMMTVKLLCLPIVFMNLSGCSQNSGDDKWFNDAKFVETSQSERGDPGIDYVLTYDNELNKIIHGDVVENMKFCEHPSFAVCLETRNFPFFLPTTQGHYRYDGERQSYEIDFRDYSVSDQKIDGERSLKPQKYILSISMSSGEITYILSENVGVTYITATGQNNHSWKRLHGDLYNARLSLPDRIEG